MGVTTVIKDYGTDILNAIRENDLARFKNILEKQLRAERKIQKLCVSDIKHKPTKKFACPLILAARQDDPRILKYMMDRGCDPNFVHHTIYSSKRKEIVTALHISVDLGLYDSVQILLDANADCNLVDHNQETPLHIAVKKADRILVRMLLSRGADPVLLDRRGNGALHIATLYGHLQLVQTLLKYDADVYQKGQSGAIPPHIAAKEGHIHLIQLFCLRDVGNINIKIPCYADRREKAPIHLAAENGHVETVRALIDQFDAEINLRDSDGNTPLQCVVLNQYNPHRMRDKDDFTETAKMLLKARVAVNEKNVYGDTALHLAAMNQFQRIVELLLAVGANPLVENDEHLKPIDVVPDFDPVTKQLLKNAMLGPRPPISASLDSLRRGYDLSPAASDTYSIRKGDGIGYIHGSDARLDRNGHMNRSMSFMSESSMSMASASVFDEPGSRVGPPPPHKSAHSMVREQDSDQSRSSKSKSHDSVEDESVYNEIHQADTLPVYTRPNKIKKKKDAIPQQQHAREHTKQPPPPPKQAPAVRPKEQKPTRAIYEDRMSTVSDVSYVHDPGRVDKELSKILQKHKMATYDEESDEEEEERDDVSELTSVQDTESEYMSLASDQKKEKPRPVPRPRSRTSSKASSARQTPVMMERSLETHHESPQEKIYENISVITQQQQQSSKSRKPLPDLPPQQTFQQQMQEQMKQFQLQQQLQQLQIQQAAASQKLSYDASQGGKVNKQGKPRTIELQYGGAPITISLDTHGGQFSVQQYEDGQAYLVSEEGQYSLTDLIEQHNDAQTLNQYIPEFEGADLSADLDDTEFESNSMMSTDTPQEAVRQAIQQKVVELTEHRHGDAQNPDINQILQPAVTPTKQNRNPRKDTPARPQLQKKEQTNEEEDVSPDQSPNASPKYKNFQQALAFAKNQQAELVLEQERERQRLDDEQKKQQDELQQYLAHQQGQLEERQASQVKKAQKQQQQLQKILGNKAIESKRWQSKQETQVTVESPEYVQKREVQMRGKPEHQGQNRREPRSTSQYMSSAFPSSSVEDLEGTESEEEEEEDEATEDQPPVQGQIRARPSERSQQQSHDYYSITPGLARHESTQPQQFVIQPAPSNQVSESPSSKSFSSGNIIKTNRELQGQVGSSEYEQEEQFDVPLNHAVSEELLQEYEHEPGSRLRAKSEELLRSPKQSRTQTMSPSRSVGARTPDSLWSVGSNGSGLNMRVTGEMPKAFTRATKHSARTAFIKAPPQGIESSSECSDIEFHSSPPQESAIREMFTMSPTPIITDCVSPTSQHSTSPPSSSSPPEGEDKESKKRIKLIGAPIPKPYQTFGKIEPKIDALLDALSENERGLSDFEMDDDVMEPAEDIRQEQISPPDIDIPQMKGSPKAIRPRPSLAKPAKVDYENKQVAEEVQHKPEITKPKPKVSKKPKKKTSTAIIQHEEVRTGQVNLVTEELLATEEAGETIAKSPFKKNIKVKEDGPETYKAVSLEVEIPEMKGSPKQVRPRPSVNKERAKPQETNIDEPQDVIRIEQQGMSVAVTKPVISNASIQEQNIGSYETRSMDVKTPDAEEIGETIAVSSFKRNIKVREDGPETYEAVPANQVVKSPTRKKTVTVKEQRWQGENVIETLTTTVVADQMPEAGQATVAEIISSQGESSSSDSDSSTSEGTYGTEYDAERETIKRKVIGKESIISIAMKEQKDKLIAKYETDEQEDEPIFVQKEIPVRNKINVQKSIDDSNESDEFFKQQMKKQAEALREKQGWDKRSSQEMIANVQPVSTQKGRDNLPTETDIDSDIVQVPQGGVQEYEIEPFRRIGQKTPTTTSSGVEEGQHNLSTRMADEEVAFLSAVAEEKKAAKKAPGQVADSSSGKKASPESEILAEPISKPARVQGRAAARKQQQQQQQQQQQEEQTGNQEHDLISQQHQEAWVQHQSIQQPTGQQPTSNHPQHTEQQIVETSNRGPAEAGQLMPSGFAPEKSKKKGGFWSLSSMRKKKDKGVKGAQSQENLADDDSQRAVTPEEKPKKKGRFGRKKGEKDQTSEEIIGTAKEAPVTPVVQHFAITPEKEYPESPESTPRTPDGFEGTVMGAAPGTTLERSDTVKEQKEVKKAGFFKLGSMRSKKKDKKEKAEGDFGAVPYTGNEDLKVQSQERISPPGKLNRDLRTPSETNLDEIIAQQQREKPGMQQQPHHGSMETNLDEVLSSNRPRQSNMPSSQGQSDFQNAAFAALTGNSRSKPINHQPQRQHATGQTHPPMGGADLMSQLWSNEQRKQAQPQPPMSDQLPPDAQYEQPPPSGIQYGQGGAHPLGRRYFKKHEKPLHAIRHINKSLEDVAFSNLKSNLSQNGTNNFKRSKSTDGLEDRHPSAMSGNQDPEPVPRERLPSAAARYGPPAKQGLPPRPVLNSQSKEVTPIQDTEQIAQMWKENQDHKAEMQQILQSVSDVTLATTEDALRYETQSDDASSIHSESATPIFWGSSTGTAKVENQEELASLAAAAGLDVEINEQAPDARSMGQILTDEKEIQDEDSSKPDDDTTSVETAETAIEVFPESTEKEKEQIQMDRPNAPSPKPSIPQKPKNLKWGTGVKPKIAAKPAGLKQPGLLHKEQDQKEDETGPIPSGISQDSKLSPGVGRKPARPELRSPGKSSWLSEGPVEADQGLLPENNDKEGIMNIPSSRPMVVDMDTYGGDRPTGTQFNDRSSPEKVRRKKAKKPNEDLKYKDAMSDTEAVPGKISRKGKPSTLDSDIYSDAEAMEMEPPKRDPGKSLQEAALESIASDLENRPKPRPAHKPWWQESDRPINYTRGVYRPPPVHFRPSVGDNSGGSYNDSQIRGMGNRNRSFATESEGEADTEEYPQETSFDVGGSFHRHPSQGSRLSAYSTKSDNDSVFAPVVPAPASPAHSNVSSSKRVTIVEGKKGRRKGRKRDKPPSIMEPGPVDFSQYPVTAQLWMEQVDKKTVQKSKTMSFMVMPEGVLPPAELRNNLPPYIPSSDDVFLPPQWVIARGRSLRKRSKRSSSTTSLGRGDSDVETSPDRPMSPGRQTLLFFRVGSNWRDLAWILFDGIYSEAETLKLIKDIQLKHPGELTLQVRDLMHRWWKKKRSDATIEELQRALDIVNLGYIQEEFFDQKNNLTSFTDTEDDLDISEVSDTDPDVSRLMGEYEVRSMNSSFELENAPERPFAIAPEAMMAKLRQKGMLRTSQSSLGHSSSYRGQDSSHDSLLDDGKGKFLIVTPQLKHENYRHETTI